MANGHSSPGDGDCAAGVLTDIARFLHRGGQCGLFRCYRQRQDIQHHHFRHLHGVADATLAHLQTHESALVAVVATLSMFVVVRRLPRGIIGGMVHAVARVAEHMFYAGLSTCVAAVSDIIHARPCPYEADCQQYGDAIEPPVLHFGCKGTAFCAHTQSPKMVILIVPLTPYLPSLGPPGGGPIGGMPGF